MGTELSQGIFEHTARGEGSGECVTAIKVILSQLPDMSPQLRARCEKVAEADWHKVQERVREVVHVADVDFVTEGWPKDSDPLRYVDARPKRLRFEVFTMPGRLAFHQRQLSVNLSCDTEQVHELVAARRRLLQSHRALQSKA